MPTVGQARFFFAFRERPLSPTTYERAKRILLPGVARARSRPVYRLSLQFNPGFVQQCPLRANRAGGGAASTSNPRNEK